MAYCLLLNGTSQSISVADDNSLDFNAQDDFTVDLRIKTDTKAARQDLINKLTAGVGWQVWLSTDGYINVSVDDGTDEVATAGTTDLADDEWHVIEFSVGRDGNVLRLFVDGSIVTSPSVSAVGDLSNEASLYVGVDSTGAAGYFNGYMEEVRVSSCIRSVDNHNTSVFQWPDDKRTKLLFHFHEGNGTMAWDMSEERNDGTIANVSSSCWSRDAGLIVSPAGVIIEAMWRSIETDTNFAAAKTKWGINCFKLRPDDLPPPENPSEGWIPFLTITPGTMGAVEMETYEHYKFPQTMIIDGLYYSQWYPDITQYHWLVYRALMNDFDIDGGRLGVGFIQDFHSAGPNFDMNRDRPDKILWGFSAVITFDWREII